MAIYVVLAETSKPDLSEQILRLYPDGNSYQINDEQWLIASDKLPKDLGDEIEISQGKFGRVAILLAAGQYWGWHVKDLWDWIAVRSR